MTTIQRNKLSQKDREIIFKVYNECDVTFDYLSKLFDVEPSTIRYTVKKIERKREELKQKREEEQMLLQKLG